MHTINIPRGLCPGVVDFNYMNKYNLSFGLFLVGIIVTTFGTVSIGSFNGIFSKILTFFSVPVTAHLAWMQLSINLGMFIIHVSFLVALIVSFKSLKNFPRGIDKVLFGISLFFVTGILLLWFVDGSYPLFFNTWELITH